MLRPSGTSLWASPPIITSSETAPTSLCQPQPPRGRTRRRTCGSSRRCRGWGWAQTWAVCCPSRKLEDFRFALQKAKLDVPPARYACVYPTGTQHAQGVLKPAIPEEECVNESHQEKEGHRCLAPWHEPCTSLGFEADGHGSRVCWRGRW